MINMIVSYLLDGLLGFMVSPSLVQYFLDHDSTLIVRVDVLNWHSIVNFVNLLGSLCSWPHFDEKKWRWW